MVFVDHEADTLQFFIQAVAADTVLEDALNDGRAFRALKKFLLLVHRADEIPVGRTQRKDEIKKKKRKRKKNFKNMSLLLQKLYTTFHKEMTLPDGNPT